jgi:hypothetical protein
MRDTYVDQQFILDSQARRRAGLIIETLEKGGQIPEDARARLHALTRKVRMTDEDIDKWLVAEDWKSVDSEGVAALRDLRDRYEELGKYAPRKPAPAESGNQTPVSQI